MDSVFVKIPDLGDKIIRELDNQSLVRCKEVQRSWYNFITEEKILWLRIIQNFIGDVKTFSKAWKKVLSKAPVDFVAQVAITTQQFHTKYRLLSQISPIYVVATVGNLVLYQQMMAKLANMKQKYIFGNNHPLFLSAHAGNYDIFNFIVVNVDEKNPASRDGVTPLYVAAQNGHYEICKLIISKVDNKNPAKHDGVTPLYIAACNGHYEICKLIISNVDDKNPASLPGHNGGDTPLHIAAQNGHYDICKLIISNVDEKNPATHNGGTPLYAAAEKGHYEICKLIIENVNDRNPTTNSDWNPFHIAAMNGHFKICKIILEKWMTKIHGRMMD